MHNKIELGRQALRAALEIRDKVGRAHDLPLCIYDTAEALGVEVQFFAANSFNGVYAKGSSTILAPALRPYGRQAFSCAHELGHWHFGHGACLELLEERAESRWNPEEYLVDSFAGNLLMPPWAIKRALTRRKMNLDKASAEDIYCLASQFAVGYDTILNHLAYSSKFLKPAFHARLAATSPKEIREKLIGRRDGVRHLTIVDAHWESMPIDLQVGDVALLRISNPIITGANVTSEQSENRTLILAVRPGLSTVTSKDNSWSAFIRVSRREFAGRSIYRHMDDPDVD